MKITKERTRRFLIELEKLVTKIKTNNVDFWRNLPQLSKFSFSFEDLYKIINCLESDEFENLLNQKDINIDKIALEIYDCHLKGKLSKKSLAGLKQYLGNEFIMRKIDKITRKFNILDGSHFHAVVLCYWVFRNDVEVASQNAAVQFINARVPLAFFGDENKFHMFVYEKMSLAQFIKTISSVKENFNKEMDIAFNKKIVNKKDEHIFRDFEIIYLKLVGGKKDLNIASRLVEEGYFDKNFPIGKICNTIKTVLSRFRK